MGEFGLRKDDFEGVEDVRSEGMEVLEGVGPLKVAEHGVNEGSGILHVATVLDHFLFEVGSCFSVVGIVQHSPVVDRPLGIPEQGGGGVSVGCFIRPPQGLLHGTIAVAPPHNSKGVLIFYFMEDGKFLLVNLHDQALLGNHGGRAAAPVAAPWLVEGVAGHDIVECFGR